MAKNGKKRVLSFVPSIVLIVLLLSAVDLTQIPAALYRVDLSCYISAFLLYTTSYLLRALRLQMLFGSNPLNRYFLIVAGHTLLNHILPFRSGEVSLPFFLKRVMNIPYSQSISFFALLRLFDVLAVMMTFLVVTIFGGTYMSIRLIVFIVISLLLCLLCILNLKTILLKITIFIAHVFPQKYTKNLEEFHAHINKTLTISPDLHLKLFFISLMDRICNCGVTIFLVIGMSFNISIVPLIVANVLASLSNIMPINSIGSFGTLELGWTGALMLYGVSKDTAIASGFSFHILFFTYAISLGLTSLVIMKIAYDINPFRRRFR